MHDIVLFGGPKALLVTQDFVLPMRLGVTWEEQNLEGLREPSGRPKRTISCTWGRSVTDGIRAEDGSPLRVWVRQEAKSPTLLK